MGISRIHRDSGAMAGSQEQPLLARFQLKIPLRVNYPWIKGHFNHCFLLGAGSSVPTAHFLAGIPPVRNSSCSFRGQIPLPGSSYTHHPWEDPNPQSLCASSQRKDQSWEMSSRFS